VQIELDDCVPKNKYDKESIAKARLVGFPEINVILPQLLEWLQDPNWPVARDVLDLLSYAGEEIIPHIRAILVSQNGGWKYSLLTIGLVSKLAPSIRKSIRDELQRLAENPTENDIREEVNLLSKEILFKWDTGSTLSSLSH